MSTGSAPAALSALSAWSASSALSAQSGGGAAIALHGATRRLGPFTLGPLDMGIPTGMVTGFIGPDGAGKTTAIKAMLGCCPWIPGRSRSWGWTRFVGPLTELTESWAMARGSTEDLSPAARAAMTEAVLRSATSGWAAAAGFLTALALMALSGVVSVRLYERRSP